MGNYAFTRVICSKNCKKIELLAFTNKVKIIKAYIPEKVNMYISNNLSKEIQYFEKKNTYLR